jgi:hypothetical protein
MKGSTKLAVATASVIIAMTMAAPTSSAEETVCMHVDLHSAGVAAKPGYCGPTPLDDIIDRIPDIDI